MADIIEITYINWVDDEVTLKLRSMREVASFEEVIGLKQLEELDEGKVFEKTITFFKRAFMDEVERKAFFMEPMETVLDVLDEWLMLSYKGRRRLGQEEEFDDEDGLDVTFEFTVLDSETQSKTYAANIIWNILIIALLVTAVVFNWSWIIWGIIAIICFNTLFFTGLLVKLLKNK